MMQKAPKILNYKNIALEKYEYLSPHKTQNGNYQSICNYRLSRNELLPFYFETPKLKTTSGIVRIDNKFYIDLELPQSGETSSFYQFLLKNDEQNITVCHENSKEWFCNAMPLNIVENYYKTPILLKPNGKMPTLRLHLPSYKGTVLTELYNIRKEKINDILAIQEGDYIVGIVEFVGLSFQSQKFNPIYELQKIKIFKDNDYRNIPSGYIFSDINDKIDIETIPKNSNDKILEDKLDNKPIANTHPEISIPILDDNKKTQSIAGNVNDGKVISLFEMIKNTTLKDIINDNDIFLQNTRFLIEAKQKREQLIKQFQMKQQPEQSQPLNIIEQIPEPISKPQESPTSPISIQDVSEINLNIDYDLDNINIDANETTKEVAKEVANEPSKEETNEEEMDEAEIDDEIETHTDTTEDTDGIDYDILNDLEVVVFDE